MADPMPASSSPGGKLLSAPCTLGFLLLIWGVFVIELLLDAPGNQDVLLRLGALPGNGITFAQSWRLLFHALLHDGCLHIGLNTALLLVAGPPLERWMGRAAWLAIALLGALVGGVATLLVQHGAGSISVGASGALFGLLTAACLCSGPCRAEPAVRWRLWITLTLALLYSLMPNVGLAAHLGGMAVGAGIAFAFLSLRNKEPRA